MKELQKIQRDNVSEVRQVQQKKTKKHIGVLLPGDGHKVYEFNKLTFELRVAEYEKQNVEYSSKKKQNRTVKVKENCVYLTALNEKNAVKKVHKTFKNIPLVKVID